ncbi:hypothetical protein [Nitrosopumilus sp.]|uniref:hypothetical protein n=1 Tax=Nitrosopumilus sp. TaxID=2024843 RepID=UPI003D0B5849
MNLQELFDECKRIDQKLKQIRENSNFEDDDNRKHVFGVLRSQLIHYEIMVHLMHARQNQSLQPPEVFTNVIGIGYDEQVQWEEFQVISKLTLLTMSHFVIENCLKTLLSALDSSQDPPSGFYNIAKKLLDTITVSDKVNSLEILNILAIVRNSLHNNGNHAPLHPSLNSVSKTIGTTLFEFEKDEKTEISESKMVVLLDAVVDVLDEIITTSEIQQLSNVEKIFSPRF